jgi:hypothetical protein
LYDTYEEGHMQKPIFRERKSNRERQIAIVQEEIKTLTTKRLMRPRKRQVWMISINGLRSLRVHGIRLHRLKSEMNGCNHLLARLNITELVI